MNSRRYRLFLCRRRRKTRQRENLRWKNPTQLNKDVQSKDPSITHSFPSLSPPSRWGGCCGFAAGKERKRPRMERKRIAFRKALLRFIIHFFKSKLQYQMGQQTAGHETTMSCYFLIQGSCSKIHNLLTFSELYCILFPSYVGIA